MRIAKGAHKKITFLDLNFRETEKLRVENSRRGVRRSTLAQGSRLKGGSRLYSMRHVPRACIVLKCEKSATRLPGYFSVEAAHASISKAAVPPTSTGTAVGGKYSKSLSTLPSTSGIRPMRLLSFFERKVDTIGNMTLVIVSKKTAVISK